jgi:hypothetical protein
MTRMSDEEEPSRPCTSKEANKKKASGTSVIHVLISHIPRHFHTPDLRNFFAHSIESEAFDCFNYRHRPAPGRQPAPHNVCVCRVHAHKYDELHSLYHNRNWIDRGGEVQASLCAIIKIKSSDQTPVGTEILGVTDLDSLLEFQRIPAWMPQGNVGTPTKLFVSYINRCAMPQSLIAKLGLNLKHVRGLKKRAFSSVQYKYDDDEIEYQEDEDDFDDDNTTVARTANGEAIAQSVDDVKKVRELNYERLAESKRTYAEKRLDADGENGEDDDDLGGDLEEWERHEALHDDVTKQDRTSPYFFEHEIELKWEKGGSGLVFYTVRIFFGFGCQPKQ